MDFKKIKNNLLFILFSLLSLTSCTDDYTEYKPEYKQVSLNITNVIEESYSRSTDVSSTSCTDIWIFENNTLLKHQVSTDSDFGTPTLALQFGSHNLTIIASNSKDQSFNNGMWSTSKVNEVFSNTHVINVTATSSNSESIELNRRSSKVQFINEDAIPNDVSKVHLTVANHKSLDKDLKGSNAYIHEASADITSQRGKKEISTFFVNTITESATDEEDCNVMIEFLDASDNVLYHYERTVKLKANRKTILKGKFFQGNTETITVNNEWLTDNIETLF